jgi:prepilin-type N-terminal cleavage/methylation domain-containing protein
MSMFRFRKGMTILEVMLALLILGGSVAVIGELARTAFRNAQMSKDLTQAELIAESVLAKVRIGIIDLESAFDVPVGSSGNLHDSISDTNAVSDGTSEVLWLYSLEVSSTDDDGLLELAVTVRQNRPEEQQPAVCRLVRWFAEEPESEE